VLSSKIVATALLTALSVMTNSNGFAREGFGSNATGGGSGFVHPGPIIGTGYFRHRHTFPIVAYPYYGPNHPYFDSTYDSPDAVAYCMQRYPTYDPGTGSYVDTDELRHLCP